MKLNAVIDSMARRYDRASTLKLVNELKQTGGVLERASLTSVINAFVPAPSELEHVLNTVAPAGYGQHCSELARSVASGGGVEPGAEVAVDEHKKAELALAVGFVGIVGSALSVEVVEPVVWHHSADEATVVLSVLVLALMYDRYVASSVTWGRVQRGFTRLFRDDPVRSCRVDAACFVSAYVLGLPWICFRPDGVGAAAWIEERRLDDKSAKIDVDEAVERCLVWLVSGVVVEVGIDGMLMESDLGYAYELVRRCGDWRGRKRAVGAAMQRAKGLLKQYESVYEKVCGAMVGGSSVGECVALVAEELGA